MRYFRDVKLSEHAIDRLKRRGIEQMQGDLVRVVTELDGALLHNPDTDLYAVMFETDKLYGTDQRYIYAAILGIDSKPDEWCCDATVVTLLGWYKRGDAWKQMEDESGFKPIFPTS